VSGAPVSRPFRVTMLGTGTSSGVPAIGCECAVCRSADPRDRRTRPSILLDFYPGGDGHASAVAGSVRYVLVDTSTDLRAQALAHDVRRVDAILFTHGHADHVFGIDDVRRFNHMQRSPIPIMAACQSSCLLRSAVRSRSAASRWCPCR
jgi:phosphoribosyl 1,2-cyclic phosphate phosphodiesterase